jgi:hypothetical protein
MATIWRSNAVMYITVRYNKVLFSVLYFFNRPIGGWSLNCHRTWKSRFRDTRVEMWCNLRPKESITWLAPMSAILTNGQQHYAQIPYKLHSKCGRHESQLIGVDATYTGTEVLNNEHGGSKFCRKLRVLLRVHTTSDNIRQYFYNSLYRVIRKSLCTLWLQYKNKQKYFKHSQSLTVIT